MSFLPDLEKYENELRQVNKNNYKLNYNIYLILKEILKEIKKLNKDN